MIWQRVYVKLVLTVGLSFGAFTPTTVYFPDPNNINGVIPAYLDGPAPSIQATDNSSITFHLVTRKSRIPQQIFAYDIASITNSSFIPKASLKILSHGFGGEYTDWFPMDMTKVLLDLDEDINIILIDWKKLATSPWYTIAAPATKLVGVTAANLLKFLMQEGLVTIDNIHIIGHSLGSHVAGNIGHELEGKCPRVTALDPALPLFDITTDENRIDPSDGKFVEVIHTGSGHLHENGLAFLSTRGHADFYPNRGMHQPGCESETFGTCSHARAPKYYTESIVNKENFYACSCGHFDLFLAGKCDCSNRIYFGLSSPSTARGKYFFLTQEKSPYGMGLNGLVNFGNPSSDSGADLPNFRIFLMLSTVIMYNLFLKL
ncbi:unnamed protein product [Allacma fusca]|uniref:Lipase domain-containing protein n=1 Tax=Allacma fusca TaxID=39272 RepID=A0A8J2JRE5_9HEXA|nr:unnamed protein product [Allacma fusca]